VKALEDVARGGLGRVEKIQLPDCSIVARKVFDPTPDILAGASADELRASSGERLSRPDVTSVTEERTHAPLVRCCVIYIAAT
jgi:hypothetical protein